MRKSTLLQALCVTGLVLTTVGALPAAAAPTPPPTTGMSTCLISNGGGNGVFTKALRCAELADTGSGYQGSGRFLPGDTKMHSMIASIEYRMAGRGPEVWVPLSRKFAYGHGTLTAMTRQVVAPGGAMLRACITTDGGGPVSGAICSSSG